MVSSTTYDHGTPQFGFEVVLHHGFHTVHLHGRKEFAIGQLCEVFPGSADPDKFLNIAVPWGDVLVTDGPVGTESVTRIRFEVEVAPAIALPAPHDGPAAYVVAPDPVEWFDLIVWMFGIIHEEFLGDFIEGVAFRLNG